MISSRCAFRTCQTSLWLTFHLLFQLCILNDCRNSLTGCEERCKWTYPYKSSPVTLSCLFSQNSELKSCNQAKLQNRQRSSMWGAMPLTQAIQETPLIHIWMQTLIQFQWNQHYRSDENSQWVSGETQQAKKHHLEYTLATITTFTVNTKCQLEYSKL